MLNAQKTEAERLLGVSEKLLQNRDLLGSREFAVLAQETDPLLEGSDQILAIIDVLLNSEKRVNNHPDWYAILQVDRRSDDLDLIKKQYRRLALFLHPDKSRFHFADHAFKLVSDAWAVLSDPIKKAHYDKTLSFFSPVDLSVPACVQQEKSVRRPGPRHSHTQDYPRNSATAAREEIAADENLRRRKATFWTACPYCYRLYEYPKVYEECCLKCVNCDRSFHGVEVSSLPPMVPGQEAYYCCWGFFPMGFVAGNSGEKEVAAAAPQPAVVSAPEAPEARVPVPKSASTLPNWMPVQAQSQPHTSLPNWMPVENGGNNNAIPQTEPMSTLSRVTRRAAAAIAAGLSNGVVGRGSGTGQKKRGRPRKYPL